jgi:hypothetical protein
MESAQDPKKENSYKSLRKCSNSSSPQAAEKALICWQWPAWKSQKQLVSRLSNALFRVDEEVLAEAASFGYNPAALRKYLLGNDLNNATTTYYLLRSKKQSSGVDTTTQKKKE